ncbi:hypothetical protein [Chondrinema litorale]|uniref:hypothetical protein n=1 Tax=Chondrinema litorale TaxID=2994555 RepID=UPI002543217D|nr:hypothetical protein [Chondrinema litorale]UZR98489.1 hypothetical protein OQ292_31265 [Chondrinema litorale]
MAPLICGFNPTDKFAVEYLEQIYKKYPIWRGVGELLLRYDELSTLNNDELPRVNHEALAPIFNFCIKKN